jgi:hypothetical protein
VLQISPQRDQRQESLQAKSVEGAETVAVQDDFDRTEQSDLEPRWRFATDPAPVTRHFASLVAVQPPRACNSLARVAVEFRKHSWGELGRVVLPTRPGNL